MTRPSPSWHALPESFRGYAAEHAGSVLLETAKFDEGNFQSFLFARPLERIVAHTAEELAAAVARIDQETARGRYVAGYAAYECGETFVGLTPRADVNVPLLHMAVFDVPTIFDHRDGAVRGTAPAGSSHATGSAQPAFLLDSHFDIDDSEYAHKVDRVQEYLRAGHSYQVNLTTRVQGRFRGTPLALYREGIARQPVAYAAFLDCGDFQVLSFSPEMFYRADQGEISVRPMKGTWPSGTSDAENAAAAEALLQDRKNRAEHTTIVDLLRNDLGKVSVRGSVRVDRLMQVERYRTLLQMTSSISGTRSPDITPTGIFRALFPSGSITGAPKRRTMEIIRELELGPRGVYTGAIGYFGPGGTACFSVAIRTLVLRGDRFTMGVGGGITADSVAAEELAECRLKASFLAPPQAFALVETMRCEAGVVLHLEAHLRRLRGSSEVFEIPFDSSAIRRAIAESVGKAPRETLRVRLTLDGQGTAHVQASLLDAPPWTGKVLLSSQPTDSGDLWLQHKTTHRALYDESLRSARSRGFDEVFFTNGRGRLTEGAISNIFVYNNGRLVTPDLPSGVLPGILRAHILATREDSEARPIARIELADAEAIWTCSALRGMRAVTSIHDEAGNLLWSAKKDF